MAAHPIGQAEFMRRAHELHGFRYLYTRMFYVNQKVKIEIVCREHGSFWQTPNTHGNLGHGCPACASIRCQRMGRLGGQTRWAGHTPAPRKYRPLYSRAPGAEAAATLTRFFQEIQP